MLSTLRDVAAVCGAISVIVGLFVMLSKLKPVKWIFHRLIGEPVTTWHVDSIKEVVEPRFRQIESDVTSIQEHLVDEEDADGTLREAVARIHSEVKALREDVSRMEPPPSKPPQQPRRRR